jgi:imidazolonepropionase-like amidohydrolase
VPTLVIIELLTHMAELPDVSRVKVEMVHGKTGLSVDGAGAGVHIGSGSDLLGPRQRHRGGELVEKAKHLGAMGAIVSATKTNAALFRLEDRIGTIAEGKDADLILVDRDPLTDIAVLADANIPPCKSGVVVKDTV